MRDADGLAADIERDIANEAAEHVESVVRDVDSGCDLTRDHFRLRFRTHVASQARRRRLALQLAEFPAIALQSRRFFLFLRPGRRFVHTWRTMQLGRVDSLDADRHRPPALDGVLLSELRPLEDAGAAKRLRGRVWAEFESVLVNDHGRGVRVGGAIGPKLREINRAADPQKSLHVSHKLPLGHVLVMNMMPLLGTTHSGSANSYSPMSCKRAARVHNIAASPVAANWSMNLPLRYAMFNRVKCLQAIERSHRNLQHLAVG